MTLKRIGIVIVVVLILGFGYYAISPLFINVKVDEALPQQSSSLATTSHAMAGAAAGDVMGTLGHPASGTARIVSSEGKNYLRYENFKTINGPDIYVYLAKDLDAKEFVSLGKVRATEGNINYEIPAGVDPKDYPYALTWCKTFAVLFNSAKLF